MAGAEVLTVEDGARWREALPASESVFGSVEYARIQERHGGGAPRLFTLAVPGGSIAYPIVLRPVGELEFADRAAEGLFDAATPQYTGPFAPADLDADAREAFQAALSRWCRESRVVTEFGHLQPWRARTELLEGSALERDREIVYVDLTDDPERLWRDSYTHAARKNVNRARREGVRVRTAAGGAGARELHRIYEQTMDRQRARRSYYFPPSFFEAFVEELPDNSRIVVAEHGGRAVAATLYLHDDTDVYSYLGGADHDHRHLRPTNAVVDETIRWAREEGKQRLVLGGGYRPGDGIFRFKASFSPLRAELRLYRRVHLPDEYASLRDAWSARHGAATPDYFPPYRATPTPG
ncbi:MAG: lipid II:glycine glycyltransferase FemX [Solirubrobacterales bacterium]